MVLDQAGADSHCRSARNQILRGAARHYPIAFSALQNRPAVLASGPSDSEHARPARAPTVLVIDDDRAIREALAMVLADEGLECITAAHGAEGVELLRQASSLPDLIVVDLMMPVMSGWEFRRFQLADPKLAAVPTIVLTAATEGASHIGDLGVQQVLRKPIDLDALLAAVRRNLPDWQPGH